MRRSIAAARKARPDFITVDSADGGSGAAPTSLIDYMGLPIKESLPLVVDILTRFDLRGRIKVSRQRQDDYTRRSGLGAMHRR